MDAVSTSELTSVLNSSRRRLPFAPLLQFCSALLFVAAAGRGDQGLMVISVVYATVFVSAAILLDRYRRSVKVTFDATPAIGQIADALTEAFHELIACHAVWKIDAEGRTTDWKRNAGATGLCKRSRARLGLGKPDCMRGGARFPALKLGKDEIYLLPDAALVVAKRGIAAISYHELELSNRTTRFIEEERVPSDAPVVDETWQYVNKKGGPDGRFASNKRLPVCLYGELSFRSAGGLNSKIQYSNPEAADRLCRVIDVLHRSTAAVPKIAYIQAPKRWPAVLFVAVAIVAGAIQVLFYYPDQTGKAQDRASGSISPHSDTLQLEFRPRSSRSLPTRSVEEEGTAKLGRNGDDTFGQAGPVETVLPPTPVPLPRARPKQ